MSLRALLLVLLASSSAWAANRNHLGPGRAGESLFVLDSPELLPAGTWMVRGTWSVADEPLVCLLDGRRVAAIPSEHVVAGAFAWGLGKDLELSGGVPLLLTNFNLGATNRICGRPHGPTGLKVGINDPELRLRWRVLETDVFRVTAKIGARAPVATLLRQELGLYGDLLGAGFMGITGGARWRGLLAVAELGMNVRMQSPLAVASFGPELTFGAGVESDLAWDLAGTMELSGRATEVMRSDDRRELQIGLEALVGLQYRAGDVEITLGAGGGVLPGYGVPHARVVSSIAYLFEADFRRPLPLVSLRDLLLKKEEPRRPPPRPARPARDCPPPGSQEAKLLVIPGCPKPQGDKAPEHDDEADAIVEEVLEDCPVCDREDAHHHELAFIVHVFFAHDVAELSERERQRLLRELRSPPRGATLTAIEIHAHADASGTDAYNEALSARRAAHVADVLEKAGVPRALVSLEARGAQDPLVPDELDEANRRVRVEIHYLIRQEGR